MVMEMLHDFENSYATQKPEVIWRREGIWFFFVLSVHTRGGEKTKNIFQ